MGAIYFIATNYKKVWQNAYYALNNFEFRNVRCKKYNIPIQHFRHFWL